MKSAPDPDFERRILAEMGFLRRLLSDLAGPEHAEDLVQETLLRALQRPPRAGLGLRSWLGAVARNLTRRGQRSERRRRQHEREVQREGDPDLERARMAQELAGELARLKPSHRDVLMRRYFDGQSLPRIAEELGLGLRAVESRLRRGRDELRQGLDRTRGSEWRGLVIAWESQRRLSRPLLAFLGASTVPSVKILLALVMIVVALFVWTMLDDPGRTTIEAPPPQLAEGVLEPRRQRAGSSDEGVSRSTEAPVERAPKRLGLVASVELRLSFADGNPASLIPVHILGAKPIGFESRASTNEVGVVRFSSLDAGGYHLAPLLGGQWSVNLASGEQKVLEAELPKGRVVEGIVVDSVGRGVSGAELWASLELGRRRGAVVARSGSSGHFRIDALSRDRLAARAEGHAPSAEYLLPAEGELLRIVLPGLGGDLEGRVFDAEGAPLERARIYLGIEGPSEESMKVPDGSGLGPPPRGGWTDESGRFRVVGLRPGTAYLRVRAPGHALDLSSVEIAAGERSRVDVHLQRECLLEGSVIDAEGQPVANAELAVGPIGGFSERLARSDQQGRFRVHELSPGHCSLRCDAGMKGLASKRFIIRGPETHEEVIQLPPMATISGRIVDREGRPVVGWTVVARSEADVAIVNVLTERSDADGRFVIEGCPFAPHTLSVRPRGSRVHVLERRGVDAPNEGLELVVDDASPPSARLSGRILTSDGRPFPEARFTLWGQYADSVEVRQLDGDARFDVGPLPSGLYRLSVRGRGTAPLHVEGIQLASKERRDLGDLRMPQSARLVVELRTPQGPPLSSQLSLRALDGEGVLEFYKEGRGRSRSDPTAPGRYELEVWAANCKNLRREVQLEAGETTLTIDLERGQAYLISFEDRLDVPRSNWAKLRVRDSGEVLVIDEHFKASPEGYPFSINRVLLPGRYQLELESSSGGILRRPLVVAAPTDAIITMPMTLPR